ncbi:type I polyketide synthase [Umezawaea sp. NPDC059074]|uniref:type I polyketide synthase n=1 Tax=Umezawaea sp. NPDC059074 TaxID=3346716 RepID=UPI0036A96B26
MPTGTDESGFVAVIGMAGRFPGASTIERFWENLRAGRESTTRLPEHGDPAHPDYTPAFGVLDGAADFDAGFFDYSPQGALVVDPQQRVLLECAHEALERAGHGGPGRPRTGVFAGGSSTRYGEHLRLRVDELPFVDEWQIGQGNDLDFLTTRIAYHLGLTGPAVSVQSACSTSLVAVHVAVSALLAGDCDLAVAGGASVVASVPRSRYTPGGVISPDGRCRAFDASAAGTVNASAAGVVVLRPLADALADGDHVHAVIRGSAVNNDGRGKVGFTAPSVTGQAEAVRAAHLVAGVRADEIGYVEAHGTATPLGDPVEVAALTTAFRDSTDRRGFCRIGSVKTNIGHADAAAGVVGLIKAVLAVEHGEVPASLHYRRPNPAIDFTSSPFVVNDTLTTWSDAGGPRVAGVNSLGLGGTNAHVVVAQAPARPPTPTERTHQLVPLSAKTADAADTAVRELAGWLRERPDQDLADVSWTLRDGRDHHPHRRFVVAGNPAEAITGLSAGAAHTGATDRVGRDAVFLFAGQGAQHVGMAKGLYDQEPVFRHHLDEVAEVAAGPLGLDLREVLFPEDERAEAVAAERLALIAVGQPAVFAVQHALTRLLLSWGLSPAEVTGHSLGAYAAACAAKVFSPADAIRAVVERGRLLTTIPAGAMAAVGLPEPEVTPMLPEGLSVGAVNGPGQCTVTGPVGLVAAFVAEQGLRGVEVRRLRISTAGHSPLVDPVLPAFGEFLGGIDLHEPEVPILSDVTGDRIEPDVIATRAYWVDHLRRPVRFDGVLATLLADRGHVLVDLGPGRTLSSLVRRHPSFGDGDDHPVFAMTPHPAEETSDPAALLTGVGRVWAAGGRVDLSALHRDERRGRVLLPTYPFQRRRYFVEPVERTTGTAQGVATRIHESAQAGPGPEDHGPVESRSAVLSGVLAAFARALGVPDVEADDGFFDLGGDSLVAAKIAAWGRSEFSVDLSVADIIRSGTAEALADVIEERVATSTGARRVAP